VSDAMITLLALGAAVVVLLLFSGGSNRG